MTKTATLTYISSTFQSVDSTFKIAPKNYFQVEATSPRSLLAYIYIRGVLKRVNIVNFSYKQIPLAPNTRNFKFLKVLEIFCRAQKNSS